MNATNPAAPAPQAAGEQDCKSVPSAVLALGAGVLVDADAAMERANLQSLRARQRHATGSRSGSDTQPEAKPLLSLLA
jgi:hypothetical protein